MAPFNARPHRSIFFSTCLALALAPLSLSANNECGAEAGNMTTELTTVCLVNGQANLTATPSGDAVVPEGFTTMYLLTGTNGLVMEQMGPSPNFTVNSVGVWRIHALVYDPATLDLGFVQFGSTSAYDLQDLLTQGGGDICASLDINGAFMKTGECPADCEASAAGVSIDSTTVCLVAGEATLTAEQLGNSTVPPGYQERFLLTRTNGLIIAQIASSPSFTVHTVDVWRIHDLVYDPTTLDLSMIDFDSTTAYDIWLLLQQGGGSICASLDLNGAPVKTGDCMPSCTAEAGMVIADQADLCLSEGQAVMSATPDGSAVVPVGYGTVYFLSQGNDQVILASSPAPEFTVSMPGSYNMHAFVYDPATFDISSIELGNSTIMDLNAQLLQGGGGICASLELEGALFQVVDCTPQCIADAGTMTAAPAPCLQDGAAVISAVSNGDTLVPPGFTFAYLLSEGPDLTITDLGPAPDFTVTDTGVFAIHALLYDPATFDLGSIEPGETTAYALSNMMVQGGGSLCASLDLLGASVSVAACPQACTAGNDTTVTVCLSDPAFPLFPLLGEGTCPDGTWTNAAGPEVNDLFNPATDPAGQYFYTVTLPGGILDMAIVTVNVFECPDILSTLPSNKEQAAGPPNGIPSGTAPVNFSLWPNPTSSMLHVRFPNNTTADGRIELTDALGRSVKAALVRTAAGFDLDVSGLTPGLWTLRFTAGDRSGAAQFMRAPR